MRNQDRDPHGAGTTEAPRPDRDELAAPRGVPSAHTRGAAELPPQQLVWETLIAHQAAAAQMQQAHDRLMDRLSAMEEPAQFETVVLNELIGGTPSGTYTKELREKVQRPSLSIGILNPNSVTIFFSPIGSATAAARAYSVPPNCLLVLPMSVQWLEVGADPTVLLANAAVVFVWRYFTVQPAFLGKGA